MRVTLLLIVAMLAVAPADAQTVVGDRVRLNTGPCVLDGVDGTPDQVRLVGTCSGITTSAATNLTLMPTGDLVFDPTGNDLLPATPYDLNIGALSNKFLTLHAAELWVETLVAQNTIATIGGRVLVAPTNILTSDLGTGGTSVVVKYNNFTNGDRIYMEASGKVEFMSVTSASSGSGPYTYSVARDLDGSGANQWYAGDALLNTGTTGNGFIDLYSTAGVLSGTGPTIVGNVRLGAAYNNWAPRWAIGNLNGLYGYSGSNYGAAFGDSGATNVTIDATNGIRMRTSTTNVFAVDTSGNITVGNASGNKLTYNVSSGALTLAGTNAWGRNLVRNSDCTASTEDWNIFTDSGLTQTLSTGLAGWRLNDTTGTCYFAITGTPATGTFSEAYLPSLSAPIPVLTGSRYEASAYLGVHRSGNTYVQIQFLNAAGTGVGTSNGNTCTAASAGGTTLAGYCRSGVVATAPATAVNAIILIFTNHDSSVGGGANPNIFWVHSFLGEATSTQTELTPWGPAGVTSITGGMIQTDAVIARHILADSITSAKIAANTIVAADIAAGTITATQIAANTITAGQIAANTITAGQIAGSTITSNEIAANTIVAGDIAANTITFSRLVGTDITALGAVTAGSFNIGSGNFTVTSGGALSARGLTIDFAAFQGGGAFITSFAERFSLPFLAGTGTRHLCIDTNEEIVLC